MILVISNIANEAAPELIKSFPAGAASLITGSEFERSFKAGITVNDFPSSSLTLRGNTIKTDDISGVLTTVPGFLPVEFYQVTPADREYICAEINAFLLYFLSALPCKKMNPPNRKSLSGIGIEKLEWIKLADRLKIPLAPFTVKNGKYELQPLIKERKVFPCTLIGNRIMEEETAESVQHSVRKLAERLSLSYISCYFSMENHDNFQLVDINSIPDISKPHYRKAIVKYFKNP